MILYNASTSSGLRNFTRRFTNTDSTTYVDADLDASINTYYGIFTTEIISAMDEWDFQGEVATTDLVASQQEYVFPSDILKIKRIEITYDGTNWEKVSFLDINEISEPTDTTSISNDFSQDEPYADLHDNSIFLYPIPDAAVTNGIKIWYEKVPTDLSAATSEPTFARPFHIGLAHGAAVDYFTEHNEEVRAQVQENKMEKIIARMKEFYRKKNQDRDYTIQPAYVNYDYGND